MIPGDVIVLVWVHASKEHRVRLVLLCAVSANRKLLGQLVLHVILLEVTVGDDVSIMNDLHTELLAEMLFQETNTVVAQTETTDPRWEITLSTSWWDST